MDNAADHVAVSGAVVLLHRLVSDDVANRTNGINAWIRQKLCSSLHVHLNAEHYQVLQSMPGSLVLEPCLAHSLRLLCRG